MRAGDAMMVSVSTTVKSLIMQAGRRDFDATCLCDVDNNNNNRGIMNRIRNTRSPPSENGNMSAKRADLHKQPLCPLNEEEQ